MEEEDISRLPVEEKVVHKLWKARLEGYTALAAQFELSRNEQDACFDIVSQKPDLLKLFVTDSNVVAQEQGVNALTKYLEYGGSAAVATKLKNAGVVLALCEKGLASNRAGTKAKATEALLLFVELLGSAEAVVEQIVPFFDARLPKLVAGCVGAVGAIVDAFGCTVAPPKQIIPTLAKLFAHADRNVRAEATKLTVEMYKWLGEGLTQLLFPSLKPVQQRDLTAEFEKVKGTQPEQKRLTRAQQAQLAAQQASQDAAPDADVDMDDAPATAQQADFDPFDMLDPVEVLSKLPADLSTSMADAKWQVRKGALEEVTAVLSKAPKMAADNYIDLVRIFAKCMKDANIQVVQLAANGVEFLSKGLQAEFNKYQQLVVGPMIERSKEKKPAVADALANALDSIYKYSLLQDVLDETIAGMKHKTPQVKISATKYLQRCLISATTPPTSLQIDQIMETGVKLLTDSQEPIRQAATEMIGTLMKITGERELKSFLEKVDDNRLAKVKAVHDSVTVNCSSSRDAGPKAASVKSAAPSSRLGGIPALRKPASAAQAIPSKRLATSPAKRAELNSKVTSTTNKFTGRLLISPATSASRPTDTGAAERSELELLREANAKLKADLESLQASKSELAQSQVVNERELSSLRAQVESLRKEGANSGLLVKQKDAQLLRLNSDLENAKIKIRSLEQTVEMLRLQQNSLQTDALQWLQERTSPFRSPERFGPARISLTELSSRVNRLSIDGVSGENQAKADNAGDVESRRSVVTDRTNVFHSSRSKDTGSEEENWRKAAEVTAQLKARIEKMKQRNRIALNR